MRRIYGQLARTFLQNRIPTQSGLSAFEDQELKEHPVIVYGRAPFFVVISDGRFDGGPGTARHAATMQDRNRN